MFHYYQKNLGISLFLLNFVQEYTHAFIKRFLWIIAMRQCNRTNEENLTKIEKLKGLANYKKTKNPTFLSY